MVVDCLVRNVENKEPGRELILETELIRWEIPRLCRGGSKSSTSPGEGIYGDVNVAVKTPRPTAHGRHPLPWERAVIMGRASARLDFFPLPWGEGGRRRRSGEGSLAQVIGGSCRRRFGPFEGPAIVKPPALPGDIYSRIDRSTPPRETAKAPSALGHGEGTYCPEEKSNSRRQQQVSPRGTVFPLPGQQADTVSSKNINRHIDRPRDVSRGMSAGGRT